MENLNISNNNIDLHNFSKADIERIMKLLDDTDELANLKNDVIESEKLDLSEENILDDINLCIDSIDDNLTSLEKLRMIYICLGHLFSYDYRVIDDIRFATDKVIDMSYYVGRYQTCLQISEVLATVLNSVGIEAKVIERKLEHIREDYGQNHVANEVRIKNKDGIYEKYLLDLTLDLYLIQSNCRTLHFGYESGPNGEYDIIPQIDNYEMDKKLGVMYSDRYTNDLITDLKKNIRNIDLSKSRKEIIDFKILNMFPLGMKFPGYYEGKQYINMIFKELLQEQYREFNIYSRDGDMTNFKTCFLISSEEYEKWLIYSHKFGLLSTDRSNIRNMLEDEWQTNSETLKSIVFKSKQKKKTLLHNT